MKLSHGNIRRGLYSTLQQTLLALLPMCGLLVAAQPKSAAKVENTADLNNSDATRKVVAAESVTNGIGMKLILIPAGEFMMGNSLSAEDEIAEFKKYGHDVNANAFKIEYPSHRVRINRPFFMGAHHVTRGQFEKFIKDTGYKTDAEKGDDPGATGVNIERRTFFEFHENRSWHQVAFEQTDDHPVVNVSWRDAVKFCRWLSKKEAKTYRLPTEAEWEYACRAGTTTRYWCGNDTEKVAEIANTADAALQDKFGGKGLTIRAKDGYLYTSPVGSFRANPFGLYDMHGNAWQWCSDRCGGKYYEKSPVDDPKGPDTGGDMRILRGGAWNFFPHDSRAAHRICNTLASRNDHSGFRVVLEKGEKPDDGKNARPMPK